MSEDIIYEFCVNSLIHFIKGKLPLKIIYTHKEQLLARTTLLDTLNECEIVGFQGLSDSCAIGGFDNKCD